MLLTAAALRWWPTSVAFVIVMSGYANIVSDLGAAEAADDRALLERLDRIEHLLTAPQDPDMTPTVVGYVDKSILVDLDGTEIVVGTASVPVTFSPPDDDGEIEVGAGPVNVTLDTPSHDGCPADLALPAYVRTGDDRSAIGDILCCTDCQPTPAEVS